MFGWDRRRWLLVVAAWIVASCSSPADDAERELEATVAAQLPEGAEVDVDSGSGTVEVELEDGTLIAEGPDLPRPDWLPEQLPLPEDLVITSTLVIDQFRSLRGATGGDESAIRELYEAAFATAGYVVEQPWTPGAAITMKARGSDGDPVTLEVDATSFGLVLGRE